MNVKQSTNEVFDRIHHEHEALKEQLGHIHQILGKHSLPSDEVATQLRHFQTALVEHFWHEEHEGFFDEVTGQAPNLTSQAHRLCRDHQELLHTIGELAQFAAAGSDSETWWRELKSRFQALSKKLMHHESQENSLLQQAYQEDIGAHD